MVDAPPAAMAVVAPVPPLPPPAPVDPVVPVPVPEVPPVPPVVPPPPLVPELVPLLKDKVRKASPQRLAFHPPCTLQHGQQLRGGVEKHLGELGFEVSLARSEAHMCCGSAGTYSVLQPELSEQLRDRKLGHLGALQPQRILSANIGCIQHLQTGTEVPVQHWVELIDELIGG